MKKLLLAFLLLSPKVYAQFSIGASNSVNNGASSSSTVVVPLTGILAHSTIVCEFTFISGTTFSKITDSSNGTYLQAIAVTLNSGTTTYGGIYYYPNATSGSYSVTLTLGSSEVQNMMACQELKYVGSKVSTIDTTFTQQLNGSSSVPTTGPAITPSGNDEIVISNLVSYAANTVGASYTLITLGNDSAAHIFNYAEYWIQTTATATNAPYSTAVTSFLDQMVAFKEIDPPVISSSLTATGSVGSAFTYTIVATNSPSSYNATGLPSFFTITGAVISGTPTTTVGSPWSIAISATNVAGTDNETLVVTINVGGPIIRNAPIAGGVINVSYAYQIIATNCASCTYSAAPLPTGLSINTSTGLISGIPTVVSSTNVTIGATNITGTGSTTITINIGNAYASQSSVLRSGATFPTYCTSTPGDPTGNTFIQLTTLPIGPGFCNPLTNTWSSISNLHNIGIIFGIPGGPALSSNTIAYYVSQWSCTIIGWDIVVDQGTATVMVWDVGAGGGLPTAVNSISLNGESISSGTVINSTDVSDFQSTWIVAKDTLGFYIKSVSSSTFLWFDIACQQ